MIVTRNPEYLATPASRSAPSARGAEAAAVAIAAVRLVKIVLIEPPFSANEIISNHDPADRA